MIKYQQGFTAFVFMLLSGGGALAQEAQTPDDILLEQRVSSQFMHVQSNMELAPQKFSTISALQQLKAFVGQADSKTPKCVDAKKTLFGQKYVLTMDAAGKACRIYDLSFPNFKALFAKKKALQIPVQNLTSRDYLNWLDGNFDQINRDSERFKKGFNPQVAALTSWVSKLKFRNNPAALPGSQLNRTDLGLPKTFHASDLDLGSQFQFDMKTRSEIDGLVNEIRQLPGFSGQDSLGTDYMVKVLSRPELMMESVRFDWNDLDKAYDVILEGEFLPFSGPVALVNYQAQYKYAVEKVFRSILSLSLYELARFIPVPIVSSAVQILVNDTFEQVEMMYSYQMLQLEDTLKMNSPNSSTIGLDNITSTKAVELLFGQRSDLITSYIMAVAQGQVFDWENFAKLGKSARYSAEKAREISVAKMNSKLTLDKQCQMDLVHSYFGTCSKAGQKVALYSLISEFSVFGKSFGAPVLYRYQRPYETSVRRGGTWLLSIGIRLFGLQISRTVVYQLDAILKNYMNSGLLDEALLRNSMAFQQKSGVALTAENAEMMKWLYIQNLNPFLPKSIESENAVIAANKQLLGGI